MQQYEDYKQLILPILKRYLVKRAAIFGSYAKGTATAQSDFDLLIESSGNFTIFKMLAMEQEIGSALNRKVDVVEYSALKPSIKNEVLQSAIAIL